jgi:nitronate monooxygenase
LNRSLPPLKIKDFTAKFPIIQAGMGVRVGIGRLAGTVINEGGIGVIASVGLGDYDKAVNLTYAEESDRKLIEEIREARAVSNGKGPLGVNVMVALTNYEKLVRTAVKEGVELIISGAGLPLRLPAYVDKKTAIVPVVSSGRALRLVLKTWKSKYDRLPDAIILEGPLCGGHLGFSYEQLEHPETCSIEKIIAEAKEVLGEEHKHIPLIAAEGVTCRRDIERYLKLGFAGVQVGTRFICTHESGMERRGQEMYLKATEKDVVVIKSPVGLPVRVLRSPLIDRILSGKREKFRCPYKCLITCDMHKVPFCIAQALLAARAGDQENGLFMTGCNVDHITTSMSVKELFKNLTENREET